MDPVEAHVRLARQRELVGLGIHGGLAELLREAAAHRRAVGGEREVDDLADAELHAAAHVGLVAARERAGELADLLDRHRHLALRTRSSWSGSAARQASSRARTVTGGRPSGDDVHTGISGSAARTSMPGAQGVPRGRDDRHLGRSEPSRGLGDARGVPDGRARRHVLDEPGGPAVPGTAHQLGLGAVAASARPAGEKHGVVAGDELLGVP